MMPINLRPTHRGTICQNKRKRKERNPIPISNSNSNSIPRDIYIQRKRKPPRLLCCVRQPFFSLPIPFVRVASQILSTPFSRAKSQSHATQQLKPARPPLSSSS